MRSVMDSLNFSNSRTKPAGLDFYVVLKKHLNLEKMGPKTKFDVISGCPN
jgi:hypothetical protein